MPITEVGQNIDEGQHSELAQGVAKLAKLFSGNRSLHYVKHGKTYGSSEPSSPDSSRVFQFQGYKG